MNHLFFNENDIIVHSCMVYTVHLANSCLLAQSIKLISSL